ncbi:MAG: hypothetical protein AB7S87_16410 [Burkholderiales bacterium]
MRLAAVALAILLAACVPSLHPFYLEKDVYFDAQVLGEWAPGDGQSRWTFSAHEPGAYRLVHADDKGREGRFRARLFRMQGERFLDLYPEEPAGESNAYHRAHLVKAHTLLHVVELGPRLRLSAMNPDWLRKRLDAEPGLIAHERRGDQVVLTAPTGALQAFVLRLLGEPEAFGKPVELARAR